MQESASLSKHMMFSIASGYWKELTTSDISRSKIAYHPTNPEYETEYMVKLSIMIGQIPAFPSPGAHRRQGRRESQELNRTVRHGLYLAFFQ